MNKNRNYSIYLSILMALVIGLVACNPAPAEPQVVAEPAQPEPTAALVVAEKEEPAADSSDDEELVAQPVVDEDSASALASTELDQTDTQLFERTAQLFDLFETQSGEIWNEDYRLDQMALMYVRTDGVNDQYAYLINHPTAAELDGAQLVELPEELDLPDVYRFDEIPNASRVAQNPHFDFNAPIAGEETYVMKYTTPQVDEFASPVSHDWSLYVAHEGLHDDQDEWNETPSNGQDTAGYPLEADHIALIMLENEVIKAALTAEDEATREQAIKQFVAVRQTRINRWDSVRLLDLPQEQIEGTARYIEHTLGSLLDYDRTNLTSFAESIYPVPETRVRESLAFGRFYETGAALTHLVDQVGIENWTLAIENGQSQFDLLADHYGMTDAELEKMLDEAKATYSFAEMAEKAESIAATAASEPTDIWGDMGDSDFADMAGDGMGEVIELDDMFPQKPYESAPDHLLFNQTPDGYELQGGYLIQASEISDEFIRQLYSPQQNEIQVVDWTNGNGELLRITSSKGDYSNLDEALEGVPQFDQPQIENIAGNEVMISDFSDNQFTFSVANVVVNGEFIVIEGAVSYDEMVNLVTDLLTG